MIQDSQAAQKGHKSHNKVGSELPLAYIRILTKSHPDGRWKTKSETYSTTFPIYEGDDILEMSQRELREEIENIDGKSKMTDEELFACFEVPKITVVSRCQGCRQGLGNQEAHIGIGGCLGETDS